MIIAREEIDETLVKITLSDGEGAEFQKIVVRPIQGKTLFYQAERYRANQVFHLNLSFEELLPFLEETAQTYRQILLTKVGKSVSYSRNARANTGGGRAKTALRLRKRRTIAKKTIFSPRARQFPRSSIWVSLRPTIGLSRQNTISSGRSTDLSNLWTIVFAIRRKPLSPFSISGAGSPI